MDGIDHSIKCRILSNLASTETQQQQQQQLLSSSSPPPSPTLSDECAIQSPPLSLYNAPSSHHHQQRLHQTPLQQLQSLPPHRGGYIIKAPLPQTTTSNIHYSNKNTFFTGPTSPQNKLPDLIHTPNTHPALSKPFSPLYHENESKMSAEVWRPW